MTKKEVAQVVQKHLQEQEYPEGITVDVQEQGIQRRRGYWSVPVMPSAEPRKMYAYFEALAEVEGMLEEKDALTVLFSLVFPEDLPLAV